MTFDNGGLFLVHATFPVLTSDVAACVLLLEARLVEQPLPGMLLVPEEVGESSKSCVGHETLGCK